MHQNIGPPIPEKPVFEEEKADQTATPSGRTLKRLFVALIGGTVVLIGIAMIVLPGPAVIVIPAGLAILATEFIWARRALRRCRGVVIGIRRKPWFRRFRRRRKTDPNCS